MLKNLPPDGYDNLYHVFVVPTSSANDFKCEVPATWKDRVRIFVLGIYDEHGEYCPPSEEISKLSSLMHSRWRP